ncbi:hypothetical protein NPIL_692681 [Nephila pilipes]|uniref:Uncharacterized protein n=1 Tax=Nephila pilipes TaxID=299642 RepID=A0A8X6QAP3_NEPPI|nr:hypothetical protein NPIL_692681 [Nephila pilipes]
MREEREYEQTLYVDVVWRHSHTLITAQQYAKAASAMNKRQRRYCIQKVRQESAQRQQGQHQLSIFVLLPSRTIPSFTSPPKQCSRPPPVRPPFRLPRRTLMPVVTIFEPPSFHAHHHVHGIRRPPVAIRSLYARRVTPRSTNGRRNTSRNTPGVRQTRGVNAACHSGRQRPRHARYVNSAPRNAVRQKNTLVWRQKIARNSQRYNMLPVRSTAFNAAAWPAAPRHNDVRPPRTQCRPSTSLFTPTNRPKPFHQQLPLRFIVATTMPVQRLYYC